MTRVPLTERKKKQNKAKIQGSAEYIWGEGRGSENTHNAAGLPRLALPDDVGGTNTATDNATGPFSPNSARRFSQR